MNNNIGRDRYGLNENFYLSNSELKIGSKDKESAQLNPQVNGVAIKTFKKISTLEKIIEFFTGEKRFYKLKIGNDKTGKIGIIVKRSDIIRGLKPDYQSRLNKIKSQTEFFDTLDALLIKDTLAEKRKIFKDSYPAGALDGVYVLDHVMNVEIKDEKEVTKFQTRLLKAIEIMETVEPDYRDEKASAMNLNVTFSGDNALTINYNNNKGGKNIPLVLQTTDDFRDRGIKPSPMFN